MNTAFLALLMNGLAWVSVTQASVQKLPQQAPAEPKILVYLPEDKSSVALYSWPAEGAPSVASLDSGDFVRIVEKQGEFYRVRTEKDSLWIRKGDVQFLHLSKIDFSARIKTKAISLPGIKDAVVKKTNGKWATWNQVQLSDASLRGGTKTAWLKASAVFHDEKTEPSLLPFEKIADQIEPFMGQCVLPGKVEAKLASFIKRGGTYENFVQSYGKTLASHIGIQARWAAVPAFDVLFLRGEKGWARRSLPQIQIPLNHATSRVMTAAEMMTVDALARTLWVEMEDAAYYGGLHYFDAVGRVIQNRVEEVEQGGALLYSFANPSLPYPEFANPHDPTRTPLVNGYLRVLRAPKQFSGWNNAAPGNGGVVFHSLLKTLCPRVTLNEKTKVVWKLAVQTAVEMTFDSEGFKNRTPGLEQNYFYSSGGAELCVSRHGCPFTKMLRASIAGQRLDPNYMTVWKLKKRVAGRP